MDHLSYSIHMAEYSKGTVTIIPAAVTKLLFALIFWDFSTSGRTIDFPGGENTTSSMSTEKTTLVISNPREKPNK